MSRRTPLLSLLALLAALGLPVLHCGCAAPLTHGQPAEIVPQGKFQVAVGAGLSGSWAAAEVIDAGLDLGKQYAQRETTCTPDDTTHCLKATEFHDLVRAVYALGLTGGVGPVTELSVHYGVLPRVAIGGRLGAGAKRLDVDYQVLDGGEDKRGWLALASLSYSHQSFDAGSVPGVGKLLDWFQLDDHSRHNVDAQLAFGRRLDQYGWIGFGGRYLLGFTKVDLRPGLKIVDDITGEDTAGVSTVLVDNLPRTDEQALAHFAGVFANVFVGYKYLYVGGELSLAWYYARTLLLGKEQTFDGVVVVPTLKVLSRF